MSRRLGILTLHYGYNEGAVLQAFALSKYISRNFSCDVEVIDRRYSCKLRQMGSPSDDRKRAIRSDMNEYLPLGPSILANADEREVAEYVRARFEALVVGSDVVWALKYRSRFRRLFTQNLLKVQDGDFFPPFPNCYWIPWQFSGIKLAYAASAGNFSIQDSTFFHRRKMSQLLRRFDAIGVRDSATEEMVSSLLGDSDIPTRVPDPTLLLGLGEFPADDESLRRRFENWGVGAGVPAALVAVREGVDVGGVILELRRRGLLTVAVTGGKHNVEIDLTRKPIGAIDWSRVFSMFDFVVTDRMHASIFSVKNHVPVLSIDVDSDNCFGTSKVSCFMRSVGLSDACIGEGEVGSININEKLDELIYSKWNWDRVDSKIESLRERGAEFLRKHLATFYKSP